MNVNIAGLSKVDVLLALYNNALLGGSEYTSQAITRAMALTAGQGQRETAQRYITSGKTSYDDINLGAGPRPLKVDIANDEFDSCSYDREHGEPGYAEKVINCIKYPVASRSVFKVSHPEQKEEVKNSCQP